MTVEKNSFFEETKKFGHLKKAIDFTEYERFHNLVLHYRQKYLDDEVIRQTLIYVWEKNDIKGIIERFRTGELSDEDIAKLKVYIKSLRKKENMTVNKDIDKEVAVEVAMLETRKQLFELKKQVLSNYRKDLEAELKGELKVNKL